MIRLLHDCIEVLSITGGGTMNKKIQNSLFAVVTLGLIITVFLLYKDNKDKLDELGILESKLNEVVEERNTISLELEEYKLISIEEINELRDIVKTQETEMQQYTAVLEENKETIASLIEEKELNALPDVGALYILKEKGIEDIEIIKEDMIENQASILGYEGVLGGTMRFFSIKVLSDKWVFARFEDGHYGGYGFYEFRINDGTITWSTIAEVTDL